MEKAETMSTLRRAYGSGSMHNQTTMQLTEVKHVQTIIDYFSVDSEDLLKINNLKADNSIEIYLDKVNMLLDIYAPLKRINTN